MNDLEIDSFKRLDLTDFAIKFGYTKDADGSGPNSTALKMASDKVIVKQNLNGHWVYCSVRDHEDNGSIIDFVRRRQSGNFGHALKTIRQLAGTARLQDTSFPIARPLPTPSEPDRKKVAAVWRAARCTTDIPYLAGRGLSVETLSDPRFRDTFRLSTTDGTIFPHHDRLGMCGYEVRRSDGFRAMGKTP